MADSFIQLPPNSTGAKMRTQSRVVGANTVEAQYVLPTNERVTSAEGMATTFRTLGAATLTQNIFSIENASGSTVLVAVRRLSVQLDPTGALLAVTPTVKTSRITTLPTGGTALTKVLFDTAETLSGSVVCRGATASDGGVATAITGAAGTTMWSQYTTRMQTLVAQANFNDESLIPQIAADTPIILRAQQALLVQVVAAATTSNPATNNWIVNCMWEEFTAA